MGIAYNTSIVRNGLVLHLDAANPKSYPGSGTVWNDLSGQGNNGTLINSPSFVSSQGGYLTFNGTNQTASVVKPFPNITGTITQEIWLYLNTLSGTRSVLHKGNHYSLQISGTNTYTWADSTVYSYATYGTRTATGIGTTGVWKQIVVTKDSSFSVRVYVNGELRDTRTGFGSSITARDSTLWIVGYSDTDTTPTAPIDGRVSCAKIYNRALSDAEIAQNFEALRGRYGI